MSPGWMSHNLRAYVAGGQDVGEEEHLLVGEVGLDHQRTDVGEGHPEVFGLPAGEPAGEVGVAEDPGHRVAEHLLGDPGVGVGVLAAGVQLRPAGRAGAAGDGERNHHAVTDPQLGGVDAGTDLDDLTHGFVAHHVTLLHRRHVAVEQVQVRAADRG